MISKFIRTGQDLLEFLQTLTPEQLEMEVHFPDKSDDYAMHTCDANFVEIATPVYGRVPVIHIS